MAPKAIQPIPIDRKLYRAARCGQNCKPIRCAIDPARRRWYASHRTERLAKLAS